MSNTLTTVNPTLMTDTVLPALKLGLIPLDAMSVNYASEQLWVGKAVKVYVSGSKTAGAYSSTFESGDTTTTGTDVTITAPRFSAWYVDPQLEGLPTPARWMAGMKEAAYAVAKDVLQLVLANYVTANIGNGAGDQKTVTAANYDVDDLADQWGLCKTKGVAGGISAIHNIAYATALLKDAALQDRSASDDNILSTGELTTPLLGMRTFYTDAFPTAVTNENTGVICTGRDAIAVAIGSGVVPADGLAQASGLRETIVSDPDTGLSATVREWVDTATGKYWGAVYVFTGVTFLRNAASRVLSA